MNAPRKVIAIALLVAAQFALAFGPAHRIDRHSGRKATPPAPTTENVTITGEDIQIAQIRAAEPTGIPYATQAKFRVASYSNGTGTAPYDEATLIRPCAQPCSGGNLLPASLQGATIVAVRFEIDRTYGCNDCEPGTSTFHLKQILRTDIDPATVTWQLRATGSAWQTNGAMGASDAGASLTSVAKSTYAYETYVFNTSSTLVAWMQSLANGSQTQPWLLMYLEASRGTYSTFDGPTGASPLRIVVTKQVP